MYYQTFRYEHVIKINVSQAKHVGILKNSPNDGSFENPNNMFKLMIEKKIKILFMLKSSHT